MLEWRDNISRKILKKRCLVENVTEERGKNLNHDASKCRKITDTFFRKTTVTEWVYFAFVFSLYDIFVCNLISCYSWWLLLNGIQNLGFKTTQKVFAQSHCFLYYFLFHCMFFCYKNIEVQWILPLFLTLWIPRRCSWKIGVLENSCS